MRMFPPSLPADVLTRAFRSTNGELGILPADTDQFLTACEVDYVEVLGWELVDHFGELPSGEPVRSMGAWYGLIPTLEGNPPAVIGGHGDSQVTRQEIGALKLVSLVDPRWHPYLRYNFTLDG